MAEERGQTKREKAEEDLILKARTLANARGELQLAEAAAREVGISQVEIDEIVAHQLRVPLQRRY